MRLIVLLLIAMLFNTAPLAKAGDDIDVVSFNIRHGWGKDGFNSWPFRHQMVTDYIRDSGASFLGLQEVLKFQLDMILKAAPKYTSTGIGRDDGKEAGEYSPILYDASRFELLSSRTLWLSDTPDKPSASWGNSIVRIVTIAEFKERLTGQQLYVFNSHFDHRSAPSRLKSAQMIADLAGGITTPTILMGDFNTDERSKPLQALYEKGFRDSLVEAGNPKQVTGTFNGFTGEARNGRIDFILIRGPINTLFASVDTYNINGRYPSDHYPVLAKVSLGGKPLD